MAQYDINLREYWRVVKKRKPIVILITIILGLASTFFAFIQAPVPLYTSTCSIKFERETNLESLYIKTFTWSGGNDMETQMAIIKGQDVILDVGKDLGRISEEVTLENARKDPRVITIIESIQSKIIVNRENSTNILNINVTDIDPIFAQKVANSTALAYIEYHTAHHSKRAEDTLRYINEQLNNLRQQQEDAEETLNRFSQDNQLLSIDLQGENLLIRTREIRDEIRILDDEKGELELLYAGVSGFIKDSTGSDRSFYSTKANQQYQIANDKFVELVLTRITLLENFTYLHPEVIEINHKINEKIHKMEMLLRLQIESVDKRKEVMGKELDDIDSKAGLLMEKKLEYERLKREVENFREMAGILEQRHQEALIRKADKPEEVVLIKSAFQATTPINPHQTTSTGFMGAIIGIVMGLVLAFILETFDTSLGAIADVESTLGASVLGVIPQTDGREIQESLKDKFPDGISEHVAERAVSLICHFAPQTMIAESFRALRTNIQFREGEDKIKCIAITSTSPQEGKTLVSINTSVCLAQAGLKILLVGADMRKPTMGKGFGLEITPGLSDILLGNYPWSDTVKTITDMIMGKMSMDELMMTPGLDNLHIITSGSIPSNPSELMDSSRLKEFIKDAGEVYDIIILDAPPVLSTADAAILGTRVDGVLLVYRVGAVSRALLRRAATQIEQVGANIMGVVLNGMKPDISPDFHDFNYYRYYSYYGENDKKSKRGFFARFIGRKRRGLSADRVMPSAVGRSSSTKKKKAGLGRWLFLAVALLVMAAALLWYEGVFDLDQYLQFQDQSSEGKARPPGEKRYPIEKRVETPGKDEAVTRDPDSVGDGVRAPKDASVSTGLEMTPPVQNEIVTGDDHVEKMDQGIDKLSSYPYSVRLASFKTRDRALNAAALYEQRGLPTFIVKIPLRDLGIWYRVYTGFFREEDQALEFIMSHELQDTEVKKTFFACLLGIYTDQSALEGRIMTITDLGFFPYVIKGSEGESRLYTGGYLTKAEAEEKQSELMLKGIQGQVVRR